MYNRQNTFTNDILYEIMIHLDVDSIQSLCLTDKMANTLCDDKSFWMDKMNREQLPLLDASLLGYKQIKSIQDKVIEKINDTLYMSLKRFHFILMLLPKHLFYKLNNIMDYNSMYVFQFSGIFYIIRLYKNPDEYDSLIIKYNELVDFLTKMYYYYPLIESNLA